MTYYDGLNSEAEYASSHGRQDESVDYDATFARTCSR